ncbi:MAG: S4 domain-containing protein, partial [Shewanella sp.]
MQSKRGRLDRFLCSELQIPRKSVRELLLAGRVRVDGAIAKDLDLQIDEFARVQ